MYKYFSLMFQLLSQSFYIVTLRIKILITFTGRVVKHLAHILESSKVVVMATRMLN
jgi:hypothetical protein